MTPHAPASSHRPRTRRGGFCQEIIRHSCQYLAYKINIRNWIIIKYNTGGPFITEMAIMIAVSRNFNVQESTIDYGPLENDLGYVLRRAQLWVFQDFIRTMTPLDLRPAQYSVLVIIHHNPGLSQIALAGALGIERARLVRLLDQLEERKLVERRPAASDRRSHAMHLTREGERVLAGALDLVATHRLACLEEFGGPNNYETLVRLLAKFGAPQ